MQDHRDLQDHVSAAGRCYSLRRLLFGLEKFTRRKDGFLHCEDTVWTFHPTNDASWFEIIIHVLLAVFSFLDQILQHFVRAAFIFMIFSFSGMKINISQIVKRFPTHLYFVESKRCIQFVQKTFFHSAAFHVVGQRESFS